VLAPQYKPENAEFAEKNGSFRSGRQPVAGRRRFNMPVLPAFLPLHAPPDVVRSVAA
jgi:hypothetical protein